MAGGFNFTANLNVQLNAGSMRAVQGQLTAGLKGLTVPVNVTFSPTAQSSLNALNTAAQALSASLRTLQADANAASASLNNLAGGMSRFRTGTSAAATAAGSVSQSMRTATAGFRQAGEGAEYFGHQMRLTTQRFVAFTASVGGLLTFVRYIREAAQEAYNFEKQMTRILQISTEAPSQVAALGTEVGRVATQWGVSSKELIGVAEQLKQAGLSISEVQQAMEPLAKASLAPSFGDMAKTTQGAIAATRQFNIEIKDLEDTLGSINAVSAAYAVESQDIIEAVKRAGGAFKAAGGNFHEFQALFTSVRATTRETAETIATGMRTIFTRLQRPETIENLRALNIQLQYTREEARQLGDLNLEGKFVGPMEAVRRISQEMKGMSAADPRFAAVAEQMGGYRQISQVIPLIQQQRLAQDALNTSLAGGNSLTTMAEKAQGALFVQVEKVRQELMTLGRNVLASSGFRAFVADALKLASALVTVADAAKPLVPILMGLAAVRIGQSLGSVATGFMRGPMPSRFAQGGVVDARVMPGEFIYTPEEARKIGLVRLRRMNDHAQFASGGLVPGTGSTDSVPMALPAGSFVIKKRSVEKIGVENLNSLAHYYGSGGPVHLARGGGPKEVSGEYGKLTPKLIDMGVAPEAVGRLVQELTRLHGEVAASARVFVQLRTAADGAGKTIEGFGLAGPVHGRGKPTATPAERKQWQAVLSPEQQAELYGRNVPALVSKAQQSGYGKQVGGMAEDAVMDVLPKALRKFDPSKMPVPRELGRKMTADDVMSTDPAVRSAVDSSFQAYAYHNVPAKLKRMMKKQSGGGLSLDFEPTPGQGGLDVGEQDVRRRVLQRSDEGDEWLDARQRKMRGQAKKAKEMGLERDEVAAAMQEGSLARAATGATPAPATARPSGVERMRAAQSRLNPQAKEEFLRDVIATMRGQESPGFHPDQGEVQAEAARRLGGAADNKAKRAAINQAEKDWQATKEVAVAGHAAPPVRQAAQVVRRDEPAFARPPAVPARAAYAMTPEEEHAANLEFLVRRRGGLPSVPTPPTPGGPLVPYSGAGPSPLPAGGGQRGGIRRYRGAVEPDYIDAEYRVLPNRLRLPGPGNAIAPYRGGVQPDYIDAEYRILRSGGAIGGGGPPGTPALGRRLDPNRLLLEDRSEEVNERAASREARTARRQVRRQRRADYAAAAGRRDPDYGTLHPEEDAYQRDALDQARMDKIAAKQDARWDRDKVVDPLAQRATMRRAGMSYGEILTTGGQAEELARRASQKHRADADAAAEKARQAELYGPGGKFRQDDIGSLAQKRALAQMERMGGRDRLSQDTQNTVLLGEHARIQQEAVAVTARQILAQGKATSATEARKMAEQQYAEALRTGQKVVSERGTGRTLGFAPNVEAMAGRPDGRSRLGGWVMDRLGNVGSGLSAGRQRLSNANDWIDSKLGGRGAFNMAAFAATGAASLAADRLERSAGTAENAVEGKSEGSYRTMKAAGGTLSGAAIGASLGLVFGPVGAAVGGVVGGLLGLTSSLTGTASEIRQANLGKALAELGTKLAYLSNGVNFEGGGLAAATTAVGAIGTAREQMRGNASAEASGWFSFDAKKYQGVLQKEERQGFGGQLTAMNKVLGDFADDLVKKNPAAPLGDLVQGLRQGNAGLNAEMFRIIASLRGVPVAELEREWRKSLQKTQNAAVAERESARGRLGEDRQVNSWGRLVTALETAASTLDVFQQKAKTLGDLFEGQASAGHVSGHADAFRSFGTGDRRGFTEATGVISAAGGEIGGRFAQSANVTNLVAQALPSVLAAVASTRPLQDDQPAVRTRRMLTEQLGYKPTDRLPAEVQAAIDSVIGSLSRMKPEEVARETLTDSTKFGQKLLSGVADPQKEYGEKSLNLIAGEANRLAEGLTQSFRQLRTVSESIGRGDQARLVGTRQAATFRAEEAGRKHDALDFVSLDQLRQPFQARQERLVGVGGAAASDPGFIGGRLRDVNRQVVQAAANQQEVFNRTGGKGPAFEAAALNLSRLKDEASRLQEALRHLADASERNAGAQEKLAKIQADKDSRLSFGERYVSASGDERVQMQRGMLLTNQAANLGSLRGFQDEDQRLILSTLQGFGQAKLTGFKGQPNAADLRENLIKEFMGDTVQDPANRRAEAGLKKDIAAGHSDAEAAANALAASQKEVHADFFNNLKASHAEFFARLAAELTRQQVGEREVKQGQVGDDLGKLRQLQAQRNVLGRAGITTDAQFKSVEDNRRLFETLAAERNAVQGFLGGRKVKTEEVVQAAGEDVLKNGLSAKGTFGGAARNKGASRRLLAALAPNVADPDAVAEEFGQTARRRLDAAGFAGGVDANRNSPEVARIVQESLRSAIVSDTARELASKEKEKVAPAQEAIRKAGLNPNLLGGGNPDEVFAAMDALKGKSLSDLDAEVARTTERFRQLGQQIDVLKQGGTPAPAVGGFATGGTVPNAPNGVPGRPKGTDTVPAWLTPDEYVVNAEAAKANRRLLEDINSGRGVAYRAFGGGLEELLGGEERRKFDILKRFRDAEEAREVPSVEELLQRQALAGPGGASGQLLFGREIERLQAQRHKDEEFRQGNLFGGNGRRDEKDEAALSEALARNHYNEQANSLRARQRLAQFGQGRPGSDAQAGIAGASVASRAERDRRSRQLDPVFGDSLRRGRKAKVGFGFADGGVVPGTFTGAVDDVPARLTKGEYVLSRPAVRAIGVSAVERLHFLAKGGQVQHLQGGGFAGGPPAQGGGTVAGGDGLVAAFAAFNANAGGLANALNSFGQSSQALAQAFNAFGGNAGSLAKALSGFPGRLTVESQGRVEVILNGAEVLARFQDGLQEYITSQIDAAIRRQLKDRLPDA